MKIIINIQIFKFIIMPSNCEFHPLYSVDCHFITSWEYETLTVELCHCFMKQNMVLIVYVQIISFLKVLSSLWWLGYIIVKLRDTGDYISYITYLSPLLFGTDQAGLFPLHISHLASSIRVPLLSLSTEKISYIQSFINKIPSYHLISSHRLTVLHL